MEENKIRSLFNKFGILIAMGTCLMLIGGTKSVFFLFGLIVVVISSYGLGYFSRTMKDENK